MPLHSTSSAARLDRADSAPSHSAGAPGLWLSEIRLTAFRNYQQLQLPLTPAPVVLSGPNGAGKTNLLEAVSLLAPGRGLRRASRDELACHDLLAPDDSDHSGPDDSGSDLADNNPAKAAGTAAISAQGCWAIFARLQNHDGVHQLGTGIQPEDSRRSVRVDGQPASQSDLGRLCAVSWLTPQMDGLFLGSPSARRRFIDRLAIAFDPAHVGRLSRYERAYRERSKLLVAGTADPAWLASLEAVLAETGVAIMATRAALIADLNRESLSCDTGFPKAELVMQGGGADLLAHRPAVEIEDHILSEAKTMRQAGDSAMPGPQASDLFARHLGHGRPAHLASTGEQKALLISIILAHARLQARRLSRPPLLILDDVAAHLDKDRRRDLFAACHDLSGQIWYSGTDRSDFAPLHGQAQFLQVDNGQIYAD